MPQSSKDVPTRRRNTLALLEGKPVLCFGGEEKSRRATSWQPAEAGREEGRGQRRRGEDQRDRCVSENGALTPHAGS